MAQKGDRRRGKPLNPDLGYAGDPVHHATSDLPPQRIGIRELRQHASVYVDLVERGYTVDVTNRGRLVAQMVPVRDPESPLERWIAKGVIERAEDEGSVLEIDPYPGPAGQPAASEVLARLRTAEADREDAGSGGTADADGSGGTAGGSGGSGGSPGGGAGGR